MCKNSLLDSFYFPWIQYNGGAFLNEGGKWGGGKEKEHFTRNF
jgi:hypothetical protein